MESYDSEPEEGQIIEEIEPPRSKSPTQKDIVASAIKLSPSAKESVEKEQVHIKQSTSLQRASHEGGTASNVVVQQSVIYKDISANAIELSSSAQEVIEKEQVTLRQLTSLEIDSYQGGTAGIIVVQQPIHKDMAESPKELRTSAHRMVEEGLSTSPARGYHQGGSASTAIVQQSEYTASESRHGNVGQPTLHKTCYGEHNRSYSQTVYSSSKERHKKRKQDYFRYSDYRLALQKIEEVCSQRNNKLLLRQNGDRKKFEIVRKEQEFEFFQEHVHSYKVHYACVMPTIRYCTMKLPKLYFNVLRERFHKHMQSQLRTFVKQQIKDRNKENRIKERWILEAKAGCLKKYFYDISLSYSEFKWEKLEWRITGYSNGEVYLKNYDMQSLTTQIEAIASNTEPEGSFASDDSDPVFKNSPSMLETNVATKLGFSVGVAEVSILENRSSQATCAPMTEFYEKDGIQIASSVAAGQNECGKMDRPNGSQSVMRAALEPAKAVTAGKASDVSEPILETNRATEEVAALESSSSHSTCALVMEFREKDGTQIAFSAAAENEVRNAERPCASQSVTNAALELEMPVTTDSQNAPLTYKEKRRRKNSSSDNSKGPCSSSQIKLGEKDGTQIAFSATAQNEEGNIARPCVSLSVTNAALELATTVNTDSENAPSICTEKRRRTSSGDNISEVPGKASDVSEPILETNRATEEVAALESSSSQSTCALVMEFGEKYGTPIAFSAAAENEVGNAERPCASQSVTNVALELEMPVTTDSQNAPLTSKEKRRRKSSSSDNSKGPCSSSQIKLGEKDGTQIAFLATAQNEQGNIARPCVSLPVANAALELATTVNTDSENAPSTCTEKRRRTSSGDNISEVPCSRSWIKFPYESTLNLSRTALHHEEPPAARPPPHLANNNQMVQTEDTRSKEVSSHQSTFAQVTEQPNMHSSTPSSMVQYHCGPTCQTFSHTYQPPAGNTHSVRAGFDSLEVSNVNPPSANQVPTGYTPEQCLAEDGPLPNPLTIELHQLQVLHDLIEKRHKEKREQLILARQIELAEAKRKYDELVYKSEVEILQRNRDLKITRDKIYKQQILADVYQVIFKASAKVVPDSPRDQRTMAEPNRSSDQQHLS